jgi:hypothetical protein
VTKLGCPRVEETAILREVALAQDEHLEALKAQHSDLEAQIEEELGRPMPDDSVIGNLKKQKLRIKDEIAQLVE